MKTKKKMRNRLVGRILALTMAVCLLFSLTITASAETEKLNAVADGTLYFAINMGSKFIGHGTCFLINEDTVITCNHCVVNTKEADAYFKQKLPAEDYEKGLNFSVVITRDFKVPATLVNKSENMDFAILKLAQPIKNKTPLKLRDSREVKASETAYSVGFPGGKETDTGVEDTFDAKSIVYESGTINKVQYNDSFFTGDSFGGALKVNASILMLSGATFSSGNSGGPVVDANGNVVGVCSAGDDMSCYAIAISQVMEVLDAIGIPYTPYNKTEPEPVPPDPVEETPDTKELSDLISEAEEIDEQDYTEDSYKDLKKALKDAKSALSATEQSDVDTAVSELQEAIDDLEKAEKKSPLSQYAIIGIIAFVVIVIIVVVILLVVLGKKNSKQKTSPAAAPTYQQPGQQRPVAPAAAPTYQQPVQQRPVAPAAAPTYQQPVQQRPVAPASSETTVLNQGAGETTVLAQGAGETTVLAQNVNGGSLVRSSNNESIPICSAEFTVGRERRSVDYCVGGNTNISRVHARFVVRDGKTYIVDNKAANGTFVNGVKARPGQEIELKDGDKILLADEKFEYKK